MQSISKRITCTWLFSSDYQVVSGPVLNNLNLSLYRSKTILDVFKLLETGPNSLYFLGSEFSNNGSLIQLYFFTKVNFFVWDNLDLSSYRFKTVLDMFKLFSTKQFTLKKKDTLIWEPWLENTINLDLSLTIRTRPKSFWTYRRTSSNCIE